MTVAEPVFVDTNVLVYVSRKRAPKHVAAVEWLRLVEQAGRPVWTSRQIHDADIVATMLANGIRRLLTFNTADFRRFEPLVALEPLP